MTTALLLVGLAAFGVATGAAAGLLGVGGGIVIVPFLTLVVGVPQHAAEATSLLVVLPTAVVASIGIVGAVGGAGGALLALTLSGHALRVVFAAFLALVGVRLVYDSLRAEKA